VVLGRRRASSGRAALVGHMGLLAFLDDVVGVGIAVAAVKARASSGRG
jgi:hypothetical protein